MSNEINAINYTAIRNSFNLGNKSEMPNETAKLSSKKTEAEFKQEVANAAGKMEAAEQKLIDAIKSGNEKDMMLARIQYDKASRVFSAINEFLKNKATMILNVIHSMRLG